MTEQLNLLPCPMCGNSADLYKLDGYHTAMCSCGVRYEGISAERCATAWNRRAAPVVGDDGLPPLPEPWQGFQYNSGWKSWEQVAHFAINGPHVTHAFTVDQVRQAQRAAIVVGRLGRANIGARTVTNPDGSVSTFISERENDLENDLAAIRDLFPKPDCVGELHNMWSEACSEPHAVVSYVKAQFDAIAADRAARANSPEIPDGCGRCPRDTPYGPATCGQCMEADRAARAQQQAQSVGEDVLFGLLLGAVEQASSDAELEGADPDVYDKALSALIAYIDGRTAGAAVPKLYTCIGKGGKYELIGEAIPAGVLSSTLMVSKYSVYRNVDNGKMFVRTSSDFYQRMTQIAAAPSPQQGKEGGN